MNNKASSTHFATGIGSFALISWASVASLVVFVGGELPLFEKQCILFFCSFLLALFKFRSSLIQVLKQTPLKLIFVGIIGIYLNNLFFMAAFANAPPEKVDLINYLWPLMVILCSGCLPKERLTLNQVLGALVAFYGVYLLVTNGAGLAGFETQYWKGYFYALLDAICWTYFTLSLRKYKSFPLAQIGVYCGVAALLSLFSHVACETFVMPNAKQLAFLAVIGITSQGAAYYFWDYGIKKGDYKLLCILSYFNPILSVGLLATFGFTHFTTQLLSATILVSLGAILASKKVYDLSRQALSHLASLPPMPLTSSQANGK